MRFPQKNIKQTDVENPNNTLGKNMKPLQMNRKKDINTGLAPDTHWLLQIIAYMIPAILY